MASTEKRRGKTTPEAVLEYCTSWTQAAYRVCWPDKGAGDATTEEKKDACLAIEREMMAMLRHEIPEQDDTASASEPVGGDNESDLASAVWQGFDPKFPDPARFDEPPPVHLLVKGKPDDGMPRREVTQDELRHLRLYPERGELSGGGLKFEGLLFLNAAERLPVDEDSQPDDEAPETRKEKRARKTTEKYKRWYDRAQEIKEEGKWTRPTEIASAIAKREKGSGERGVNAANIRRRLDDDYPGWAERGQAQNK